MNRAHGGHLLPDRPPRVIAPLQRILQPVIHIDASRSPHARAAYDFEWCLNLIRLFDDDLDIEMLIDSPELRNLLHRLRAPIVLIRRRPQLPN